jgi:hypothetical protein
MLRFLRIGPEAARARVFDGKFELRIAAHAAEASSAVQGAARSVILMWIAGGLLGLVDVVGVAGGDDLFGVGHHPADGGVDACGAAWSAGGRCWRRAWRSALGMLAHEEQLILAAGGWLQRRGARRELAPRRSPTRAVSPLRAGAGGRERPRVDLLALSGARPGPGVAEVSAAAGAALRSLCGGSGGRGWQAGPGRE